jgi:hypothetical protein
VREEARVRVVGVVSSWVLIAFFFFGNTTMTKNATCRSVIKKSHADSVYYVPSSTAVGQNFVYSKVKLNTRERFLRSREVRVRPRTMKMKQEQDTTRLRRYRASRRRRRMHRACSNDRVRSVNWFASQDSPTTTSTRSRFFSDIGR